MALGVASPLNLNTLPVCRALERGDILVGIIMVAKRSTEMQ
jgi:hypothetical protein